MNASDEGRHQHQQAAQMIFDLTASQLRHAYDLGQHAAEMGLHINDNPFRLRRLWEEKLANAWEHGWTVKTDPDALPVPEDPSEARMAGAFREPGLGKK